MCDGDPMTGVDDQRVVRVLPDVPAIDKEFDYVVPSGWSVQVGDVVRVQLHGRRVGGWITAVDVEPAPGVVLRPLAKVSGLGPTPELIDLATWAAWRWAGRRASFLRTAAPPGVVRVLPRPVREVADVMPSLPGTESEWSAALARAKAVLRMAPGTDRYPLVLAAVRAPSPVRGGHCLVLCPSVAEARNLGRRLRRDGVLTAIVANDGSTTAAAGEWARAAAGAVVVGARAAAWAPLAPVGRVLMLDEHDEAYKEESSPTWHARDVVIERARRAGAPCLLVSPTPTLEALAWGELLLPSRAAERAGWPRLDIVDQRELDPSLGPLFSPRLVSLVRGPGRVLCVLNRTGRARLLACGTCTTLARCEVCDAAVSQLAEDTADNPQSITPPRKANVRREDAPFGLSTRAEPNERAVPAVDFHAVRARSSGVATRFGCGRCGAERPAVCLECGGTRFKALRLGVSRAREELETLAGETVAEVTGATALDDPATRSARILVGTEALLHRVRKADAVAFLDFDQELLALRFRAGEQALALLARAARVVRRADGSVGHLLVQTRTPDHPALMAARVSDPGRLVEGEVPLRRALSLPPSTSLALVSGAAAEAFMTALGSHAGVEIRGPLDGAWRLSARDHQTLCDALAGVTRPPGRLRIEVDPLRI